MSRMARCVVAAVPPDCWACMSSARPGCRSVEAEYETPCKSHLHMGEIFLQLHQEGVKEVRRCAWGGGAP